MINILSFDLEQWFLSKDSKRIHFNTWNNFESRIEEVTYEFLNCLQNHNVKATFFVLGWIADQYPELIKKIDYAGHEIGYHSYYHFRPGEQTDQEFEDELVKGLDLLQNIIGKKVTIYRAPYFSVDESSFWIYPILLKNGITISSSTLSNTDLGNEKISELPFRIISGENQLIEFPLNRMNLLNKRIIYSGSGYFRVIPFSVLKRIFENKKYNLTYFHPRDFDSQVPYLKELSLRRNLMNKICTAHSLNKLDKLLSTYNFLNLSQSNELFVNSNNLITIKV